MARHLLRISLCCGEARKRELLIDPTRRRYPSWGGALNLTDPGLIPPQLPELTMAEEMLIARAHVQMDISRVRGCQYKYKGHVISWMQNIPKMVQRLPSLPSDWIATPYRVIERVGTYAYKLDTPPGVHPVFHVSLLKRRSDDPLPSQRIHHTENPPIKVDGQDEYEVESILGHRRREKGF